MPAELVLGYITSAYAALKPAHLTPPEVFYSYSTGTAVLQPESRAQTEALTPQTAKATGGCLCSRTCPALGRMTTPPETGILPCSTWVSAASKSRLLLLLCLPLAQMRVGTSEKKAPGCFGGTDTSKSSLGKVRQAKGM